MIKLRIAGLDAFVNNRAIVHNDKSLQQAQRKAPYNGSGTSKVAVCLALCLLTVIICPAQTRPNLQKSWQIELGQRYDSLRRKTTKLAREHGWPIYKNYSRSRQLVLQDVDPFGQPIYYTLHNAQEAHATRTQSLYKGGNLQLNLSGSSSVLQGKLGMWDGGRALSTHQELAGSLSNPLTVQQMDKASALNNHTTHLAGTLVARGINPEARGMAFGASLSIWDYTDDLSELTTAAPGLLLSNHAYGPVVGWVYNPSRPGTDPTRKWEWWGNTTMSATDDYLFGFYTAKARDLDRIAYNNPFYLMVRSADNKRGEAGPPAGTAYFLKNTDDKSTLPRNHNDAYDVIPAEATAKNVLTVGAADVLVNPKNQSVSVSSTAFSGWGPTDDGRIKPDLLGMGSDVFSTLSDSSAAYGTYTGTSMASANVTGSLALLQELYTQQKTATAIASQNTISNPFMRAATLRGLVLHTATRNTPASGPDYRQGWGLLNTEAAARVILNTDEAHRLLEKTLESGGTFTERIVAQGNEPLIITLCWTDPEGPATLVSPAYVNSRTPKLVNDLDSRLTNGVVTAFPFILDPTNPDKPATSGDNYLDTVEQIYIPNPTPGQAYTLSVSHKGKMTYAGQPFTVIVSGLRRSPCQFAVTSSPKGDTTLCAGGSLLLRSDVRSWFTYQWLLNSKPIPNANNPDYRATQAGSYVLRITDGTGCVATSTPITIQMKTVVATLSPAVDQWLCPDGKPLQLVATNATGSQLAWLRNGAVLANAQSTTLTVDDVGRYQVRLTQQGCETLSDTVVVRQSTVDKIVLKPDETELLLLKGATVTLVAPTGPDYNYQWFRDTNPLMSATNDRLSVGELGVYKVRITQQNCVGWSAERTVYLPIITSLSTPFDSTFLAYPNPAEQTITVQYTSLTANSVLISIVDVQGRTQQMPITLKPNNHLVQSTLPINNLAAGIYYIQLHDGDRTRIMRFVKR